MVCQRCIMSIEDVLKKAHVPYSHVLLGEIHLQEKLSEEQKRVIQKALAGLGFEMIDSHQSALIEKIKFHVIKKARRELDTKENKQNLSVYLSDKLHYEYTHLSSVFSSVEGRTIENFFIEQRIEKAKELLIYAQMTLTEIAVELDYSSTAHLSSQFKKITGLTPSHFKHVGTAKRKALDKV
ncbi:MAG: helix-turn-helix transcriptional regulator [Chitinophagales bacterium]|nr:helix-turn-helix transcriptional regulator [Chitinophagales bacterium]